MVQVVAVQTRKCITSGTAGAPLVISACDGSAGQQWRLAADGTIRVGKLCMDARSDADLAAIDAVTCTGDATQIFAFDGDDHIVNGTSGKCLDIYDGRDTDGTPIVLWPCLNHGNQVWYRR
ncbi:RICIN domain-containing protein [Actinoplanes missouriensis]|uniref:RICIN domain-containing protein n=1 Tax=Actinoplanes missouriensis TaxID=1866 RepID=UPI00340D3D72